MIATMLLPYGRACLAAVCGVGLAAVLAFAPPALADAVQPIAPPTMEIPQAPRLRALDLAPFAEAIAGPTAEREAEILAMVSTADLATIQEALWDGSLTSVDLTTFYLARIVRHDDRLRAFLELNPNALTEALAADAAFRDGQVRGPAVTVPMGLNDAGWPMGATPIGRKGEDARLLAVAWGLERGTQARVTPASANGR